MGTNDKLVEQLKFYFSDANLRKDRFMMNEMKKFGGSFNKVIELEPNLSPKERSQLVVKILRGVPNLKLNPTDTKVRRTTTLPEWQDDSDRTIFLEGIHGEDTHETVRDLCAQHGDVTYVSLPRFENRDPKGFAFVEFANADHALDAVVKMNGSLNPRGGKMLVMLKYDWAQLKHEYKELQRQLRHLAETKRKEGSLTYKKGLILKFEDCQATQRPTLKKIFETFAPVAFIEYETGASEGFIRFANAEGASTALKEASSSPDYAPNLGDKATTRILSGDEEYQYWEKVSELQKKRQAQKLEKQKEKESLEKETPPAKRAKVETPSERGKHTRFDEE